MHSPEAEILAQVRKVQAELHPVLPAEVGLVAEDTAAVQIRVHLLRARLEFSPEQEATPLPLTQLLAVLFELAGHAEELSRPPPDRGSESNARLVLLQALRNAVLTGEVAALRTVLEEQRRTLASSAAPFGEGSDIHPA